MGELWNGMNDNDYYAMLELASEMSFFDAAKFIRSETGISLKESADTVANIIASRFPNSKAAITYKLKRVDE